jgi:predicted porin
MKKQFIAAAVAAALAAPAMAQNVTIGGTFDVGYDLSSGNTSDALSTTGVLSTPNMTMGGSEDLGGGLKAFFNINTRIGHIMDIEGKVGSDQDDQDTVSERMGTLNFGDRGAQVGVSGSFGEVAVGKTTGSAMGGLRGGVNGNLSLLGESTWGDRPDSMISYTSPAISGVKVRGIYQTTTKSYELSAAYAAGPLTVAAAMNEVKAVAANSDQGTAAVLAGSDKGISVSYNAGVATIKVAAIKNETFAAAKNTDRSIGVSIPQGKIVYGLDAKQVAGVNYTNATAVYSLSKRTNVYFAVQKKETNDYTNTYVGMRHSF